MKSSGRGVISTIFCIAAANASAVKISGRSKHSPHESMMRFSGTPSRAGSTSCSAMRISDALSGAGRCDSVSRSSAARK